MKLLKKVEEKKIVRNSYYDSYNLSLKKYNTLSFPYTYIFGKLIQAGFIFLFLSIFLIFSSCDKSGPLIKQTRKTNRDVRAFSTINDGSEVKDVIDLNGPWKFKATDEAEWMNADVPGTIQEDLIRVGRLEDPYYRDNEFAAQWVEKKEWEYERSFTVDESFLDKDKIILDCRGLDFICELYLNDKLIANTQNMFIEYEFNVKDHLHKGTNTIRAVFRSVLDWTKKQADADPRITWATGEDGNKATWKGNLFYSRKEASDFGWDWGIRLVSCGIWKSIRLVGCDLGRITQLGVRQDINNTEEALLFVTAEAETYDPGDFSIDFEVMLHDTMIANTSLAISNGKAGVTLKIPDPQLWWPNGLGEHPLYTVKAVLKRGESAIHKRHVRIGLRTIEIEREKDDRGETFGIRVNGKLIFCKGANWIPADAMPGRLTESHYRHLLGSCVDANMNMLRIWGGGLYEPDVFYEFCDENGLMIWHDFMFASGPYLATEQYLENVKAEIKNVVLRRRHHPSIALWCGNNEQEVNMSAGENLIVSHPTVTWQGFDKIFYEAIPQTASIYDPDRPYWPSSPHNPLDRERKNSDFETASGDAHIWDVWHGEEPFSWYEENKDFRFVSEYGFQSIPVMQTVRSFTAPEDRYFISSIMDHHNMAGKKSRKTENMGNIRLAKYTSSMFRLPKTFEDWIYITQVMHGEGMKVGSEAFRRNFPNTTGALYWQVNDNWPTISGSGMDYYGRWKALQYMVRHFFSPVLVSGVARDGKVQVFGSNDLLEEKKCILEWELQRFDGTRVRSGKIDARLPANQSSLLETLDFSDVVNEDPELITYRKESYRNRSGVLLSLRLVQGENLLSSNTVTFLPPKYWALEEPGIKHTLTIEQGRTKIVLTADRFAAWVELGVTDSYAQFSDNYFHLLPGESKTVYVISSEVTNKEFMKGFFVRSLIDTY